MQVYPEKNDQLGVSSEEKSFLRTLDRALVEEELAYYVLHINPRRKDIGNGMPELFDLLVIKNGIMLLRFIEDSDIGILNLKLKSIGTPLVFSMIENDIQKRLCESRYLTDTKGKLIYDVQICFVVPNASRSDVVIAADNMFFSSKHVLFKDDLQTIRKEGASSLFDRFSSQKELTENEVNHVFQRLCPEITIPRKYMLEEGADTTIFESNLDRMDRAVQSYRLESKQIDIVNKISKGHQLILACAGSGKSVLLISKCFKIASLNPREQFLITCYNRNLHDYYDWAIAQAGFTERNVRCSTFYGLCNQLLESNHLSKPISSGGASDEYFNRLFLAANSALERGLIKERFLGIFIDEVQIFKPEWYRFCFNLLKSKKPENYFFTIAGDKSQDITNNIKNSKAPWQGNGEGYPEYRGKTIPIEINYRNSKPINTAIDRFVEAAKQYGEQIGADLSSDPELFLRGTAYRSGNKPQIIELADYSNEGEANAIGNAVLKLIKEKHLSEVDIAIILYNESAKYVNKGWKTSYYRLLPYIRQFFNRYDLESPTVLMKGESEGATYGSRRGVTVASIEGALGLDFRAVILAGLRPLGRHEYARNSADFLEENLEKRNKKLEGYKKNINFLYTGCTRAKDELIVVLSDRKGASVYMDLIRDSMVEKNERI